jgi:hypothetical protein
MTVHSSFLGSVTVSGDEAKAFTRKLSHGRGSRSAQASAQNGRKLAKSFAKMGSVIIKLKPARESTKQEKQHEQ